MTQFKIVGDDYVITLSRKQPRWQVLERNALIAIAESLSAEGLEQAAEFFADRAKNRRNPGPSVIEQVMAERSASGTQPDTLAPEEETK